MAAYVEDVANQFDFADPADWKEIVESGSFPASSHFSLDAQEATLVGYVPWNKQRSAARYFLGFAYADDVSPYRLHRENPMFHPEFPWLYCYDVSFTPFRVKSNPDESGKPKIESPFVTGIYTAYAEHVICTARFRNFRMRFLEDSDIIANNQEFRRNCVVDITPRIEALTADGVGQLFWKETAAGGPPTTFPTAGSNFPAPIVTLLAKTAVTVSWFSVPWDYLSQDGNVLWPTKILDRVGHVNSDTFMDIFTQSTLLMQPPTFTVKPFPVTDADDVTQPLRAVDVQLNFEYFDPPKHASLAASSYRGHQLMPWRKDGLFYGTIREDNATQLLPFNTFSPIFEHVSE